MHVDARAAELTASPKARWALAWLAAAQDEDSEPADFHAAATARIRSTRLHHLRTNEDGLVAEIHTRVEDWRYNEPARTAVDALGPAEGYQRIAAALTNTPAARWWWDPIRRNQQVWICTEPIRRGRGLPFTTSYAHHWDSTRPATAFTTSTQLIRLPAMALLFDQNRHPAQRTPPTELTAWHVPIKPDARVAEIHSPNDWVNLVERYPSHRTDRCLAPHLDQVWPDGALSMTIDWHRLSRDYDGVHLSVAGWLTATSRPLPLRTGRGHTFCEGWPTEATTWFRPVFTGEFTRLTDDELPYPLHYGYGRPAAGSHHDLTIQPLHSPWWRNLLRLR